MASCNDLIGQLAKNACWGVIVSPMIGLLESGR